MRALPRAAAIGLAMMVGAGSAVPARAQQADAGVFRLYQGGAEIGREVFRDDGTDLTSTITIPLIGLKLVTEEHRAAGRPSRAVMRAYHLTADTLVRTYTAVVQGDSMHLNQRGTSGPAREWVRAAGSPDEISAEQSLAGFASLVRRSNRTDRTYGIWLPSVDSTMPVSIAFRGDSVAVQVGPQHMIGVVGPDGRLMSLEVPTSRVRFERFTGGVTGDSLPPLAGQHRPTPDYSAPADAPYTAQDVRVPVQPADGDTFSLACTLTKPKQGGPRFPAAVTITGSGQEDRDENLWPLVPDYRIFRQVADRLGDAGIAVLRCDDRQFGGSGGAAAQATSEDFANDAAAQIAWLRARSDINPAKIAVIGHSEGGIIGPMLAARDPRIAAVVIMAGSAKNGVEVLLDQVRWPVESATSLTAEQKQAQIDVAERAVRGDTANPSPWMRWFRAYEPLPTARRVRQPVLIVQGEVDRQVTAGQADTLAAAMRAAGNRDVTVRKFPGLNHLFLVSPGGDGAPAEYASLTDVVVPDEVLDTITTWLAARLR